MGAEVQRVVLVAADRAGRPLAHRLLDRAVAGHLQAGCVFVDRAGELRQFRQRFGDDVLVFDRRDGEVQPRELAGLVPPVVGGHHAPVALDTAAVGDDSLDRAARHVHVLDGGVAVESGVAVLHVPLQCADAVDPAVGRRVVPAQDLLLVHQREVVGHLGRREELRVRQAVGGRPLLAPAQEVHALLAAADLDAPNLVVDARVGEQSARVVGRLRLYLRGRRLEDDPRRVHRRATCHRERPLVDDRHVLGAEFRQMIRDAAPDGAGADDQSLYLWWGFCAFHVV